MGDGGQASRPTGTAPRRGGAGVLARARRAGDAACTRSKLCALAAFGARRLARNRQEAEHAAGKEGSCLQGSSGGL